MSLESLLFLGGSALVQNQSDRDVEKRQKRIIDAMQEFQTGKARKGEAAIEKFLVESTPQARAAENQDVRSELQRGLGESVGVAQAFEKPDNFSGRVTEGYAGRSASNQAAVKERIRRAMEQLAIIGSPSERGLREQFRFGHAGGDVDAANSAIRNVVPAYHGAISQVRPNAFDTFAAQALMGAGLASADKSKSGGTLFGVKPKVRYANNGFGPNVPGASGL